MTTEERAKPHQSASVDRAVPAPRLRDWRRAYARGLAITDFLVLVWAVFGTQIAWFGLGNVQVSIREDGRISEFSYWIFSSVLIVVWMWTLALYDSRGHRIIGVGADEYKRIFNGSLRLFGVIAIVAFLLRVDLARGYLLIAFPVGVIVLIASRWLWRQWLRAKRESGEYSARLLLVGTMPSVAKLAAELARHRSSGYLVVGACVPDARVAQTIPGTDIPVMSNVDAVPEAMAATGADTVAVTSTDELPPERVRRISWALEPGRQHLVVAPSLVDIGGPRISTRPVAGLPLIHVETPSYAGRQVVAKRVMDLLLSGILIVMLSPLLAIIAMSVRLTSAGPVLFRQERVGRAGKTFMMLKFRSMVIDAEARLLELEARQRDAGNDMMFKLRDDPRVTRVGRMLRRYSLDELPQLFNVFGGSMSIVGPRPPLLREVERYETHVHRRFLVKPGITGLWQVSGRSNLSWEETVRLDLYYVENWSVTGDVAILWRTARAVLAREGAY